MSTTKKILLALGALFVLFFSLMMVIGFVAYASRTPEEVAADNARRERVARAEWNAEQEKIAVKLRAKAEEKRKQEEKRVENDFPFQLCYYAEEAVKASLKSPASAKFSSCIENEVRGDATTGTYWVKGHVDAQNSFGALLRSRYIVRIHSTDKKSFTVGNVGIESPQ